jgi:hypothetical protein
MEERNGQVAWGEWSFDYSVLGSQALSLLNGFYRGRYMFAKLSLPVIRVKYGRDQTFWHNPVFGNGCGPYNDQITWDTEDFGENLNPFSGPHHLVKMSNCGKRYICIRENHFPSGTWLELGVYARIGAYHIYQAWYLNNDGVILPRLFSKGLSCNLDHWHHPYWRFDIDPDGKSDQRVNVFDGKQFVGYIIGEGTLHNAALGDACYNVQSLKTAARAWIFPPVLDPKRGVVGPTPFSNLDGYVRKYRPGEDGNWPHKPEHDIGFAKHENPDGGNVVFWSVCHLHHRASEGKHHWHEIGPKLVFEIPPGPPVAPEDRRCLEFKGHIHIKDFRLVGHDKWGHFKFDEKLSVAPDAPHREIHVTRGPTGDVTADLIFRADWHPDRSVGINFTAQLRDSLELVASRSRSFNVLRDSTLGWSGLHLVDHHRGDPDTGDMDFTVSNHQCPDPGQSEWRYCGKCHAMFFDGYRYKGVCAAGGGHEAAGFNFTLPHDVPQTPNAQRDWRYCHKCHVMFFDGYRSKGQCPAGDGHEAAGFNFVLPHDVVPAPLTQTDWRFCHKCEAMFFDGYPDKGVCASGGGHEAKGFNFALSHL